MDTLKTAVVVVLLLAVVYGVYVVLNKPDTPLPHEIAWHEQKANEPLQIESDPTGVSSAAFPSPAGASGLGASPLGSPGKVIHAELSPEPPAAPSLGGASPANLPADSAGQRSAPDALNSSTLPAFPSAASVPAAGGSLPAAAPAPAGSSVYALPASPAQAETAGPSSPLVSAPSLLSSGSASSPADSSSASASLPAELPNLPSLREGRPEEETTTAAAKVDQIADKPEPLQTLTAAPVGDRNAAPDLQSLDHASTGNDQPAGEGTPASQPQDLAAVSPAADTPGTPAASTAEANTASVDASTNPPAGGNSSAEPAPGGAVSTARLYEVALREAHSLIDANEWYQALFVLSKFYDSPDLSSEQHQQLLDLLDPLAAKVVYSTEHLIEPAHEVVRGDTLARIAEQYQVPPELLANINGVENPDVLVPGTKLKVVRGPFRAEVNLAKGELTLFASQLYAGRFPVSLGKEPAPKAGEYRVQEKQPGRVYYAGDGRTIAVDDPANPYGQVWIGIGSELCIHGSSQAGDTAAAGCISLSPRDAYDVYSILSVGSSVIIR